MLSNVNYTPIGVPDTNITGPAFTGEWRTGGTGIQYHRARHLSPGLGVWLSLDPFEGVIQRPMSLNGYSWVEGNVVNSADPSGLCVNKSLCLRFAPEDWRCNCLSLCTPAPTCDELLTFNCTQLWEGQGCGTSNGAMTFEVKPGALAPGPLTYSGGCILGSTDPEARRQCAIVAYNGALQRNGGSLTIDEVIALTIQGEAGNIYGKTADGLNVICRRVVNQTNQDISCDDLRGLLERSVIRNLTRVCNNSTICTAEQFTHFIGEAQVWFNAGRSSGVADEDNLNRLFGGGAYTTHLSVLERNIDDPNVQSGCQSFACSWGNCKLDLRNTSVYRPDNLYWMYHQDSSADYYIREPVPVPGGVIFIVGAHLPCEFD